MPCQGPSLPFRVSVTDEFRLGSIDMTMPLTECPVLLGLHPSFECRTCREVVERGISGGPTGGHLKGGHLKIGFRREFSREKSTLGALFKAQI